MAQLCGAYSVYLAWRLSVPLFYHDCCCFPHTTCLLTNFLYPSVSVNSFKPPKVSSSRHLERSLSLVIAVCLEPSFSPLLSWTCLVMHWKWLSRYVTRFCSQSGLCLREACIARSVLSERCESHFSFLSCRSLLGRKFSTLMSIAMVASAWIFWRNSGALRWRFQRWGRLQLLWKELSRKIRLLFWFKLRAYSNDQYLEFFVIT